jgi:hypothetical protein
VAKAKRKKSDAAQRTSDPTPKPSKLKKRAPKKKCCASSTKCGRCPLRMLKEGTLPPGYTVRKRRLVELDAA